MKIRIDVTKPAHHVMSGLSGNRLVSRTRTGDQKNQANNSERRAVAHDLAGTEILRGAGKLCDLLSLQAVIQICGAAEMALDDSCSQAELLLRLTQIA